MLDSSEMTAVVDGAGSFSGEFEVTSVDEGLLKELGAGPKWAPTGSVGVTFHDADLGAGRRLVGQIGGGSTTLLTIETPVPEPLTLLLVGTAALLVLYQARRTST
jgi:hypothetical protein